MGATIVRAKGKMFFAVVAAIWFSLSGVTESEAGVEKYADGVVRDGIAFVSAKLVSKAFGADLRWGGDIRTLWLTYKQTIIRVSFATEASHVNMLPRIKPTIDLPAIMVDGEVFIPLIEVCEVLGATVTFDAMTKAAVVARDDVKMIVDLSSARSSSSRERRNRKEQIALPVYRFTPSAAPDLYDTELDSTTKEASIPVNLKKAALVVIDFWGDRITNDPFYDNTAALVRLARKHGIPVIHIPNEGLALPGYRMNPRILPIPDGELVLTTLDQTIESFLSDHHMDVDTLFYAGYVSCECMLFTKVNSINNLAARTDRFKIILVKDATSGPYWCHSFAVNGIETQFVSTTLNNMSTALGDDIRAIEAIPSGFYSDPAPYRIDADFGLNLDFHKTSVVLINVWDYHENDGWLKRIKYNTAQNIVPLVQFARSRGMRVVHIPNGREVDPSVKSDGPDEPELKSIDAIKRFIADNGISTVIYAGNLINTTELFRPMDVWGFSRKSPLPVVSRILEDCLTVFEAKESFADQQFKKVFLERATYYTGDRHEVTTFGILQGNTGWQVIAPGERVKVGAAASAEGRALRLIASVPGSGRTGGIMIGDRVQTLLVPSETLKGVGDVVVSEWGRARVESHIRGADRLIAESESSRGWKRGHQGILFSDSENSKLDFRFGAMYPIQGSEVRLTARNYADRSDIRIRVSVSYDEGQTFRLLEEKRIRYNEGDFIWYLREGDAGSQSLWVRIEQLHPMHDQVGIESVRVSLDLRASGTSSFDGGSLWIANQTKVPIKFAPVKPVKLQKIPVSSLRNP